MEYIEKYLLIGKNTSLLSNADSILTVKSLTYLFLKESIL